MMKGLLALYLGVVSAIAWGDACPSQRQMVFTHQGELGYDHLRYAPVGDRLVQYAAFTAEIDGDDDDFGDQDGDYTVTPEWVSAHIKAYPGGGYASGGLSRPNPWYRIDDFDTEREYFGVSDSKRVDDSYRGVGRVWNRGHLLSRTAANRVSPLAGCETHVFSNAVPQHADLNQGIWLALENRELALADAYGEVFVVTGTLYSGEPEYIGDRGEIPVAVPSHLWKVMLLPIDGTIYSFAYLYPNVSAQHRSEYLSGRCNSDKRYDHTPFQVSLKNLELRTGLSFAPNDRSSLAYYDQVTTYPTIPADK